MKMAPNLSMNDLTKIRDNILSKYLFMLEMFNKIFRWTNPSCGQEKS